MLSDDWKKLVLLEDDRTVEFHSQHGSHYKTRIPKHGRDLAYNTFNWWVASAAWQGMLWIERFSYAHSDLFIASGAAELYRLNLDQGRFLKSMRTTAPEANVRQRSPAR